MSAIPEITAISPPPPSLGIPDWRRFQRCHPKPIPDWRRLQRKSIIWRGLCGFWGSNYPITKLPIYPILPLAHDSRFQLQLFVFSKSVWDDPHPWVLPHYSSFLRPNQLRIRTMSMKYPKLLRGSIERELRKSRYLPHHYSLYIRAYIW